MSKLIELVENPETTAPELARFISNDPALTAKILKLSNSAFYGFPQRIGTINLAIVVLGFQSVKDLGLSAAVVETFGEEGYLRFFDPNKFWLHSIAVAAGCKILSREGKFKVAGEIFVTGLLHDIGVLVLSHQIPDEYEKVIEDIRTRKLQAYDAELEHLGFTHADVGGWLLEKWNLPAHQAAAVYDYPHPWLSFRQPNISMLINFSDILARRSGYPRYEEASIPELHPKVISYLNLKSDDKSEIDWKYYCDLLEHEMSLAKDFLSALRNGD